MSKFILSDRFNSRVKSVAGLLAVAAMALPLSACDADHPNLLPAYDTPGPLGDRPYVKKARLGREGASVSILQSAFDEHSGGQYDTSGFVYQQAEPLPEFNGKFPVIGSWVVGGKACGMGIREDTSRITRNSSMFVPHYFVA